MTGKQEDIIVELLQKILYPLLIRRLVVVKLGRLITITNSHFTGVLYIY